MLGYYKASKDSIIKSTITTHNFSIPQFPSFPPPKPNESESIFNLPILHHPFIMSSAQNNNANGATRPTGATGGGHQKNTCRNYQQPGHPPQYMFVDLPGALCAHCQVSFTESVVPRCANHRSSVQTTPHAEADRVYLGVFAATDQRSVPGSGLSECPDSFS